MILPYHCFVEESYPIYLVLLFAKNLGLYGKYCELGLQYVPGKKT